MEPNVQELINQYNQLLNDSKINLDEVPFRNRGAMAIKRNDAISFLPAAKKRLLNALISKGMFQVSSQKVTVPYTDRSWFALESNNVIVFDSEELYRRVAVQIWSTIGHKKTFGAHQMRVFLDIVGALTHNVVGQGSFQGLSQEKYLASYEDCLEYIRQTVESVGGLALNRAYLESSVSEVLIGLNIGEQFIVRLVNVPEKQQRDYSTLLFNTVATIVQNVVNVPQAAATQVEEVGKKEIASLEPVVKPKRVRNKKVQQTEENEQTQNVETKEEENVN